MNNKQSICQTDTNTIGVRVSVCGTVILYPTQKRLIYTFSFGLGTVFTQVGRFGRNFLRICINLTNVFAAKNIRFSQFARTKKKPNPFRSRQEDIHALHAYARCRLCNGKMVREIERERERESKRESSKLRHKSNIEKSLKTLASDRMTMVYGWV